MTVGVTGTNGKTSTVAMVAAALSRQAAPVARVTSLGAYLGDQFLDVPRSYPGLVETLSRAREQGGRFAVIEWASWSLAQGFASSWPVRIAVFTNLTHDHLDYHGTFDHYFASKARLFQALPRGGTAVLNACDPTVERLEALLPAGVRPVFYGAPHRGESLRQPDFSVRDVAISWQGTRVEILSGAGTPPVELDLRAIGEVFAENAVAAYAAALAAGVPAAAAAAGIAAAKPPAGRFEILSEHPWVVLDSAHTPDALARTLATARRLCPGRLTVVFGAGGGRDRQKRPLMGAAASSADRIVLTNDNPRDEDPISIVAAIREGIGGRSDLTVETDRARAIELAVAAAGEEDVVLVAGRGPETHQLADGQWRPLSDRDVIRGALRARSHPSCERTPPHPSSR